MADPISRQESAAADWPGMVSNIGTRSRSVGVAAVQVNLASNVPGEVTVRPGLREVVFEAEEE